MPNQVTPKGAWVQMLMLFLYMVINFADKLVLQIASVPMMAELNLSPEAYGAIGSYFFLCLSIAGVVVGFVANRVSASFLILLMGVSWALVQFPMVLSVSFTTIVIFRMLLGLGEGGASSVAVHHLYKWFPDQHRAVPTALLSQGAAIGVVFAAPALTWVVVNVSWHAAFGALGAVGLVWTLCWWLIGREGPLVEPAAIVDRADRVPYAALIFSRTFIGCVIATFGAYWSLSLGLTWFVPFAVQGLGFSQTASGYLTILPWGVGAITVIAGGVISQLLTARGVSTRVSRGLVGTIPLAIGGCFTLMLPFAPDAATEIALLMIGTGLTGPIYVVCAPMLGEFIPDGQRAGMIATYGALYAISAILAPSVMGYLVQHGTTLLSGYQRGFMVAAAVQLSCALIGMVLLAPAVDRARIARLRALPAS